MDRSLVTQRGAATLTIALALIMAITMLSYAVAYTANTEQRMTQNDQLRQDSLQAAEAGILYSLQWLGTQRPDWIEVEDRLLFSPSVPSLTTATRDSFAFNIVFEAEDDNDRFIHVTSDACAANTPEICSRISLYAKPISILTDKGERAPPLILDGCVTASSGQPRLLPDPASTNPVSAISSHSASCLDPTLLNLGTGRTIGNAFAPNQLWQQLFGISREEFQTLADAEDAAGVPDAERNYWLVAADDLNAGRWDRSLGSPEQPVILVVPASLGCPAFGGGAIIHGLVYIDASCDAGAPVWDNLEIFGALAIAGNSAQLSADVRITHIRYTAPAPPRLLPPLLGAVPVPGTWSDL